MNQFLYRISRTGLFTEPAAAALQASPGHSEVHYLMGVIKLRLGEGEQADERDQTQSQQVNQTIHEQKRRNQR